MILREEQAADNEALFRDVNEKARAIYTRLPDRTSGTFVCECRDHTCMEQLEIPLHIYEDVRAHGKRFVLALSHDDPQLEDIVNRQPGYLIVEKRSDAGRFV